MKYFINAGHSNEDSGATSPHGNLRESDIAMIIRDELRKKLSNMKLEVLYIPDELGLRESIDWVNDWCDSDDLAISIHLNSNENRDVRGIEAYYSENSAIAEVFARQVAKASNMTNRGVKHDSETYVGSLGWLRNLKCKSVLVECGYISNGNDYLLLSYPSTRQKIADGIINSIVEMKIRNELKGLLVLTIGLLEKVVVLLVNQLKKNYGNK